MASIKMRAKIKDGVTTVKVLISHPMDTGLVKDKKTGEKIPAHFIQEVVCKHKDTTVMTANWGAAISKNPYLSFNFKGAAAGDTISLSWVDNKGEKDSADVAIS
ncbi:thiosulfate oxidation carrier complex protein SoxZ [Gammaproteobacteria bacterium]|jgi:sulfur-oxidizing protein SoxZ|nr:thiosulfate oxidation carrier complex protein SoxZ [Gammaproteobacteria bacterium]